jgi:hypothetical protein
MTWRKTCRGGMLSLVFALTGKLFKGIKRVALIMHNPNCEGDQCRVPRGQTRVLPYPGGNLILCYHCYQNEILYRKARNVELDKDCQFDTPEWSQLKIYLGY